MAFAAGDAAGLLVSGVSGAPAAGAGGLGSAGPTAPLVGALVALGCLAAGRAGLERGGRVGPPGPRGARVAWPVSVAILFVAGLAAGARAGAVARRACPASVPEGASVVVAGVVLDRVPAAVPGDGTAAGSAGRAGRRPRGTAAADRGTTRLGALRLVARGRVCSPRALRLAIARDRRPYEVGTRLLVYGRWRIYGDSGGVRPPDRYGYVSGGRVERVGPGGELGLDEAAIGRRSGPLLAEWRGRLARRLTDRLPETESAVARALVLADRTTLSFETRQTFVAAGIVHLLAISGLHVGLLAGGLTWILGLWDRRPRRWVAAAALVSAYVVMIGAPPAAVRAALVFCGHAATRARGRPARLSDLAGLAALAALAASPLTLTDPGFQLSFAGFGGVVAGGRLGSRLSRGRLPRGLVPSVAASAGAFAATAPLAALHFGRVVATSIPASLAATGLVALAIPAVFATAALPDPLGGAIAPAAALLLRGLVGLADVFARLPFAWGATGSAGWLWIAAAALLTAAIRGRRRYRWRYGLAAGLAVAAWVVRPGLEAATGLGRPLLCTLDVGQGDAAVVRTSRGRWLAFDAGPGTTILGGATLDGGPPLDPRVGDAGRRVIVPFLRARGVRRIELFGLSHPHLDHFGGAGAVFDAFDVARVLDPGVVEASGPYRAFLERSAEEGSTWIRAEAGGDLRVDDVRVRVLWPPAGEDSLDANEGSVGFLLDAGSFRYLNTGDASVEVEKRILEATVADSLRADVLKLGHHGSRTSSAVAWLRAVRPDIAVISAGRGNRYGHPHAVTLARLDSARVARVWRTDRDGPLCIEGDGRDWRIVDP